MSHDSREKFVVRFDKAGVRDQIDARATESHISMNGWIQQAIDEKLGRGERIDRVLEIVETSIK